MKKITLIQISVVILLASSSCNSNKKLDQKNAEKAIKEFVSTHSMGGIPGTFGDCLFNLQAISQIKPVSQFSEKEATADLVLKCRDNGTLVLKFIFQKNIDNKWFLMKIDLRGDYNNGIYESLVERNQNINIIAQ